MPEPTIDSFAGNFDFLSNGFPFDVMVRGRGYDSIDAALQEVDGRQRGVVMLKLVRQKFRNPWYQLALLATGDRELRGGPGEETLGRILTQVREECRPTGEE